MNKNSFQAIAAHGGSLNLQILWESELLVLSQWPVVQEYIKFVDDFGNELDFIGQKND